MRRLRQQVAGAREGSLPYEDIALANCAASAAF
jgi:hypothetical protein